MSRRARFVDFRLPLLLGLSAAAVFSCSFGANDFKIVPASSAGTSGSAGSAGGGISGSAGASASGGTAGGGTSGSAGTAGSAGTSGSAGTAGSAGTSGSAGTAGSAGTSGSAGTAGGDAGSTVSCVDRTVPPLLLFSSADLHDAKPESFVLVPGANAAVAIAVVSVQGDAGFGASHVVLRMVSDSQNGVLQGIGDITMQGHFNYGAATMSPNQVIILGADQRGVIALTVPIANGTPDTTAVSVAPLATPPDCANGGIRDIRGFQEGAGFSYAVSCQPVPNNQNLISLWLYDANQNGGLIAAQDPGADAGAANADNVVRAYLHHTASNPPVSFLAVGDEGGQSFDFRIGADAQTLAKVHSLQTTDGSWVQMGAINVLPDQSGMFMALAHFKDPNISPLPVEIYAGSIAASDYGNLGAFPPTQLQKIATYNSIATIFFPAAAVLRPTRAFVTMANPLTSNVITLWVLDLSGAPLSTDFPVRSATGIDNIKITTLGVSELVGWTETDSMGTRALADSVACF